MMRKIFLVLINLVITNFIFANALSINEPKEEKIQLEKCIKLLIQAKENKIKNVIMVDYGGFNLKLLERLKLKKPSLKITYYIPPKVWIWGKKRVPKIAKADEILVIFPWEVDFYKKENVKALYFGNPFMEKYEKITKKGDNILLLPGSRKQEITKLLPIMLEVVKEKTSETFILKLAKESDKNWVREDLSSYPNLIVENNKSLKELCEESKYALAASGTVILELALLGLPGIVLYKTSIINEIIVRLFIDLTFVSLPNLTLNREVYKELLQGECRSDFVIYEMKKLENNYNQILSDIELVRSRLGGENIIENYDEQNKVQKELSLIDSNGNKKVIEFILSSFETENNKTEYVAIALDITLKKERERELKQAYKVFENAHDGIIITDENVNIINVNKAFEKNTGYFLSEVKGKNPKVLKSDIQNIDFYKNMWKDLELSNYWEGEIINKRKDGKLYVERLKISTVYNEDKKLVNYIALFSDITLQKEQQKLIKEKEKILQQQSKMAAMGEMIGNIAHQWRQPLSVISVSASGIKLYQEEGLYTKEDLKDFIEAILHSTKYLSDTIDDFRNFYKDDLEKSDFEVKKSIDKTINLLNTEFIKEEIEVVYLGESNLFIHGIENQFLQVIMNILNNAKDALVEKDIKNRHIFIDLYKKNDKTYIEIQDNAGGVNEDIMEHIFEPYFTTKHKSLGTGIGLYMSEEIVTKQLNGKLFVYNKSINYKNIYFRKLEDSYTFLTLIIPFFPT